jgi:hypothetical protein
MRIKIHKTRNQYILTNSNIWVRNFCLPDVPPLDINHLVSENDCSLFLENEVCHRKKGINELDWGNYKHENVIIVSDGYEFDSKQLILEKFKEKIAVFGTNGSLCKWGYAAKDKRYKRAMTWYVVNNPYAEAKRFLPKHDYFPRCLAAARANADFLKSYKGHKHLYFPIKDRLYSGLSHDSGVYVDDYRNPICASISLAFRAGAKKILLFCCDNSFDKERPGAESLENGLWQYPQQNISNEIMDAMGYWLKNVGIMIANHSSGPNFKNIQYITAEECIDFFKDNNG